MSKRANIGVAALVVLLSVVGFLGYRFTQYGQASAPGAGGPAMADQKPAGAYHSRPQ